ncbi:RDD family protein [Parasalinivibrio latis]|uniref:RDD family protein n=1 Tax=Parasalinivibrio latis TaxID=2952610 RepID=UPI0030E4F191
MRKKKQSSQQPSINTIEKGAGFFRRLGAFIYDGLVVVALLMLAGALGVGFGATLIELGLVSMTGYVDISDFMTSHPVASQIFTFYMAAVLLGFFVFFWCRGGQTLGMRAWRLRVQNSDGSNITIMQALIRLSTACLGLGNLLVIFDPKNKAFQDHFAKCEVIVLPKP